MHKVVSSSPPFCTRDEDVVVWNTLTQSSLNTSPQRTLLLSSAQLQPMLYKLGIILHHPGERGQDCSHGVDIVYVVLIPKVGPQKPGSGKSCVSVLPEPCLG